MRNAHGRGRLRRSGRLRPRRRPAAWLRVWLAVALAVAGVLGSRELLYAHATLLSSEPAAGADLSASPPRIRLVFSEPVESKLSRIAIVAEDSSTIQLSVSGDPHDVHALTAPVSALSGGAYRVVWSTVSADGHAVSGSFVFRVGTAALTEQPAPAPAELLGEPTSGGATRSIGPALAGAPVIASVLRGVGVGALMALAGFLVFVIWVPSAPNQRVPATAMWLSVGAAALLTGHLFLWAANSAPAHQLSGAWLGSVLSTEVGLMELARAALAILALWALALARRPRLALVFAGASVLVSGAIGHPAAIHPVWTVPAKALHLAAVALWLGGLVRLVQLARGEQASFVATARRVSSVGLGAVIVIFLSGVLQTLLFLPSLSDLVTSAYGRVVLAKVAGFAILIGFGAYNRYRLMPSLAGGESIGELRRSSAREIVVMIVVVILGGFLAYIPPRMEPMPGMHTSQLNETPALLGRAELPRP